MNEGFYDCTPSGRLLFYVKVRLAFKMTQGTVKDYSTPTFE